MSEGVVVSYIYLPYLIVSAYMACPKSKAAPHAETAIMLTYLLGKPDRCRLDKRGSATQTCQSGPDMQEALP